MGSQEVRVLGWPDMGVLGGSGCWGVGVAQAQGSWGVGVAW